METRETSYPPYVVTNPGIEGQESDLPTAPSIEPDPTVRTVMTPGAADSAEEDAEDIERLRDE